MDVSVIIVNYNTKEITSNCVKSIFEKSHGLSFEIIIVDNASKDGSKEWFEKDKRVKYIYLPQNIGFGRANNTGYKQAKGKYIFCLNSDTILMNNTLLLFYNKMEESPSTIGCMGTLLLDVNQKIMHSYGKFPDLFGNLKWKLGFPCEWKDPKYMKDRDDFFFEVDYVTGADMFIRKTVIERCGFFDEEFFLYYEETEMQWRFKQNGFLNYIYTIPQIVHLEGTSAAKHTPIYKTIRNILSRINSEKLFFKKTNSVCYYYSLVLPYVIVAFSIVIFNTFKNGVIKHIKNI